MAKVTRNVTQEIKGSGSSGKMLKKATPRNTSGGIGYTRTSTNRVTGKKTTTTGKLAPTTANNFNGNAKKQSTQTAPLTKLPYKGGTPSVKKLPHSGRTPTPTLLAKKKKKIGE